MHSASAMQLNGKFNHILFPSFFQMVWFNYEEKERERKNFVIFSFISKNNIKWEFKWSFLLLALLGLDFELFFNRSYSLYVSMHTRHDS
jgi:hypothetical protein